MKPKAEFEIFVMKFKDLKNFDKTALLEKLDEAKLVLMKENAQVAIGTIPKNPSKIGQTKKIIAKIKTLLQKQGGIAK